MVAGGRKRKKKGKKRKEKKTVYKKMGLWWIFRKQKVGKKENKNKVLNFVKLEYYKEVLDFHNIEYHIAFLITQI